MGNGISPIQHLLPQATLQQILAVPLPVLEAREYKIIWSGESSGLFSEKSAFWLIQQEHIRLQQLQDVHWIWKVQGT